ncbi:hypothetical protein CEXT_149151 [Caerostris extrusa]|uniref:Uncharacterized protein n=1 Tax=Caerostris extrusa TaxID=172846 RepID=A0AAV4TS51_CAEEX|nr:hypothetical protein CEXT_149151 [Caerostris extrusa]
MDMFQSPLAIPSKGVQNVLQLERHYPRNLLRLRMRELPLEDRGDNQVVPCWQRKLRVEDKNYRVVTCCCSIRFATNIQCLPKLGHSRNEETLESSASDDRVVPCWNEKTKEETCDDQVVPCIEVKSTGKHSTSNDSLVVDEKMDAVKWKSRL